MVNLIVAIGVIIAMMVLVGNMARVLVKKAKEKSDKLFERNYHQAVQSS